MANGLTRYSERFLLLFVVSGALMLALAVSKATGPATVFSYVALGAFALFAICELTRTLRRTLR